MNIHNLNEDFIKKINSELTTGEKINIIDGIFEKVIQSTVQPLGVLPSCTWDGWDKFVIDNRIQEKFIKVLTNMLRMNHSSLILMKSESKNNKMDVLIPVSTSQIETDRSQRELVLANFVIAERNSLIYNASTRTKALQYFNKKGNVYQNLYPITDIPTDTNKPKIIDNSIIPVVWFPIFFSRELHAMINATKKMCYKILEKIISQLEVSGNQIMFISGSNNSTTQATAMKNSVLDNKKDVHVIKESLNQSINNPILSFSNQPYLTMFWNQIEDMVNSLIEGLQVGDMNQGGKGTANMHTTEVQGAFGVKMQKIINTQNSFIPSWELMLNILRDNGVRIPKTAEFSYDISDNVLKDSMQQDDTQDKKEVKQQEKGDKNE